VIQGVERPKNRTNMINIFESVVKSRLEVSVKIDRQRFFRTSSATIQERRDTDYGKGAVALLQLCVFKHTSIGSSMTTDSDRRRSDVHSSIQMKEEVRVCPVLDMTTEDSDDNDVHRNEDNEDKEKSDGSDDESPQKGGSKGALKLIADNTVRAYKRRKANQEEIEEVEKGKKKSNSSASGYGDDEEQEESNRDNHDSIFGSDHESDAEVSPKELSPSADPHHEDTTIRSSRKKSVK
jgi:hypothetical protein